MNEGYELADAGIEFARAIAGRTGNLNRARGEAKQTFLGFNASGGVSPGFKSKVR